MFLHYLIAAWRNLAANRLQSAIAIFGLAIGLTAAILAGVVTLDAFSHDHFISGYERIYFAVMEEHEASGDHYGTATSHDLAAYLRDFPETDAVARESGAPGVLRHGAIMARERFAWADPEFFRISPVPALYGDLDTALARPDGMVITLAMARKYFGYDNVVGQTLELNHAHVMTITAVIADFPLNASNNKNTVFASGLAPFSRMSEDAGKLGLSPDGALAADGITLVRLRPGASLDALNRRAAALVGRFVPKSASFRRSIHFERADALNMSESLHPDARAQLFVMEAVALVILILSCINFVSLSIARSSQRGLEVAVRKVAGAARRALIVQFLGESILQVLFALCVAIALVEWLLPAVNAFLVSGAVFDYWRDPPLFLAMLAAAMAVGVAAGAYPALVLSACRPAAVLKGWMRGPASGASLRRALVALQFAALIVFLISAGTVFRQNRYVTTEAMRVNIDQMLIIRTLQCSRGLQERIAALPGVHGAACSSAFAVPGPTGGWGEDAIPHGGGQMVDVSMMPVDFGYLELYDLKPVAGRFFRFESGDEVPGDPPGGQGVHYVINEATARRLGYASAAAAVGRPLNFMASGMAAAMPGAPPGTSRFNGVIIGVVRDFSFVPEFAASSSGTKSIPPTVYSIGLPIGSLGPLPAILHVRLSGQDIPQTLVAIDDAWKKSGERDPIDRQFLDGYVQDQEATILKEGEAFAVFAGIAMLLACLGLFGVSLSTTTRRIKEIGIRKAMGARDGDILGLLLWQFARPVLWANLIAWPFAWWAMSHWLSGFAYHVDLSLWMFPAAGFAALLIALATVAGQAALVARQKPVLALRYE